MAGSDCLEGRKHKNQHIIYCIVTQFKRLVNIQIFGIAEFYAEIRDNLMLLFAGKSCDFCKRGGQTAACPPDGISYRMCQIVQLWVPVCRSAMWV